MHPLMYEDNIAVNRQSAEGLRCSARLPIATKSRTCSCCNPCSSSPTKLITPRKVDLENEIKEEATPKKEASSTKEEAAPKGEASSTKEEAVGDVALPALVKEVGHSEDESIEKHVSVGPLFQAYVPEWTGVVYESDSKWLGTRVWPSECSEHKVPIETDTIGKGRPDFCECSLPGSVACVRFHIAEARMKLKLELGLVFYHWKFNCMGEEVSLQWTAEEEKRFRDIVRSSKHFGDKKVRWFTRKTRENLVSYYYNVFLVQKRSYQNRVTPINIDSDDDETEFGTIGNRFGCNAIDVSESNFLPCIQNEQCIDLE